MASVHTLRSMPSTQVFKVSAASKSVCSSAKITPRCAQQSAPQQATRRSTLQLALLAAASPFFISPSAFAEKGIRGFVPVKDAQDAYTYAYPFGWQEVSVDGQDSVYKDVIEPLESVSVNLVPTDKKTVEEFGDVKEVAYTLADKVLTGPEQQVTLINAEIREKEGRKYIDFEFTAKNPRYTRHAAASVTVANGQFYTLVTGSNEKRWSKMADKVKVIVKSFEVSDRYN